MDDCRNRGPSVDNRKKKEYTWDACTSNSCLGDMSCFLQTLTEKHSTKLEEVIQKKVKLLAVLDLETLLVNLSEFLITNVLTISHESQIETNGHL